MRTRIWLRHCREPYEWRSYRDHEVEEGGLRTVPPLGCHRGAGTAGVNPDSVVTSGVNLGNQSGCWQNAQAVRLQVRIVGGNPAINTNKRVELAGSQQPFDVSATANPGDAVNFKIFVENTGNGIGVHPRVTDTLDPRLTYIPNSSYILVKENNQDVRYNLSDSLINFNGQTITWAFQDMAPRPDAALYLIFQARVAGRDSFTIGTNTIPNCAQVSFDGVVQNTNCVMITVNRSAEPVVSFTIRKEVTNVTLGDSQWYDQQLASAAPGHTVAYRLIIVNTGNVAAQNVTAKDVLPAGMTFVPGSVKLYNTANPDGTTISDSLVAAGYNIATLGNGTPNTQTIIFRARVTETCSGQQTLTNVAQVIYQGTVRAQDDASLIISCTNGLIITKDVKDIDGQYKDQAGFVREGDVITYRINVLNNGNVTARRPVLRDLLPEQVSYVANSLTIDGEFMSQTVQDAFLNQGMVLTDLTPGLAKVVIFQVRVNECPPLGDILITNTAFVKADSVAEISDTARVTIRVNRPSLSF